jgi:ATP-dependent exoDNAse (exonuclease V) beta subunit
MKPDALQHLLISASAGSGKTWQLVRRHLHLLALGEAPERIAAMTFTRKAAGEFFQRILRRLAELAEQPGDAADYFRDCAPALPEQADFLQVLRQVTRRLHRLRLGTLDSFFASVTTCFPLELGLGASARVMDEAETAQAGRAALDALLERLHGGSDGEGLKRLMEGHKQATFGAEEKRVDESLMDLARTWLTLWEDSDPERPLRGWGDLAALGAPSGELVSLSDCMAAVRAAFVPPHDKGLQLLEETLVQVLETVPAQSLPKRVNELLVKLEAVWDDLPRGTAEILWQGKRVILTAEAGRAWRELAEGLLHRELLVRAERTRGLAQILDLHAREYAAQVRQRGRLSFADVQRLLARSAAEQAPWLGGTGDLWFRLDARHDHWMLDEFQDTSRKQWRIVSSLVDEVIQDDSGRRSFFAVGDPKQSIYLWREAEPELFADILEAYPARADGGGLHQQPLSVSFRSAQPVLDMVNAVFGDATAIAEVLPAGSTDGFRFQAHHAARVHLRGHAALVSPGEADLDQAGLAAALLRRVDPLGRGLSCAILVRDNKNARELAEQLRASTGYDVVCEAHQHPCTDNAVTLALLSLLTLAAHPGDRKALGHLRLTPLWPLVDSSAGGWRRTAQDIQQLVQAHGFSGFMEAWTPRLLALLPELDSFHRRRLAQMADIAAEYDGAGQRCMDGFLRHAREYPLRTRGPARSIQVMTVHAAKGLEFDLVLHLLHDRTMDQVRDERLIAGRDAEGVQWVLETPPRACARLLPVLQARLEQAGRRAAFESLCRLYVAMTRAKHGLYLIGKTPPKDGKAVNEAKFLRELLGVGHARDAGDGLRFEWETGDAEWFDDRTPVDAAEPPAEAPRPAPLGPLLRATQPLPRRRTPSGEESFRVSGRVLFGAGREPGRRLGTLVHELFAEVEALVPQAELDARWLALGRVTADDLAGRGNPVAHEALRQVRSVLAAPACAAVFQPRGPVWRERSFDLVVEGDWISGTFDRVLLDQDASGERIGAWIVDFKTDEIADEAALHEKCQGYAPQIALYRSAIARLTGLPPEAVRASLLFTRRQQLVALAGAGPNAPTSAI